MINILNAEFRRMTEKEGLLCGEVEVQTDQASAPQVLVYFAASKQNDYEMVGIVANDADYEIDWYDNPMHQAFSNQTEWFDSDEMKTGWGERQRFKDAVLSYDSIREQLARGFGEQM